MKYAFIQQRLNEASNQHRLMTFCRVLEVSRSGFYEWVERSAQPDPNALALEVAGRAAHARGRECYGPKRLRTELADMGFPRSLATVKRLRVRLGLKCRLRRRFVSTTDSNHALPIAPNLLEQLFDQAAAPNQIWVTDITYVPTDEGWLRPAGRKCAAVWQQSRICLPRRSSAGQWRITCEPSLRQKRCGWRSSRRGPSLG